MDSANIQNLILTWAPIVFFGIIVLLLIMTLRYMPRTKPATIERQSAGKVTWSDIAGADEAKAELMEAVEFLRDRRRFERLGAQIPRGILLYGPPGTGKTLLAKAVASESGANFFSASASSFVEMFAGLGAARIRRLFKEARKNAPAIVFIDELDAVGAKRTGGSFNREHDQTLNQLLVELDGFRGAKQVVVERIGVGHAAGVLLPVPRALLEVGKEEGHQASRAVVHGASEPPVVSAQFGGYTIGHPDHIWRGNECASPPESVVTGCVREHTGSVSPAPTAVAAAP